MAQNRCRCLFATHYHELARLAESCEALSLHHVRAREWKGDLVLLHEAGRGPGGPQLWPCRRAAGRGAAAGGRAGQGGARPAGKGPRGNRRAGGRAGRPAAVRRRARSAGGNSATALRERLDGLDIDALTPREALDLLYELKREAGTER